LKLTIDLKDKELKDKQQQIDSMTVDFETVANDKKDNDSRMSELKEKYRLLEEEIADSEDTDHLKDKELEQLLS